MQKTKYQNEYMEYAKALANSSFEDAYLTRSELNSLENYLERQEYSEAAEVEMNPLWYSY
jgi:hypothetical protein